MTIELAHDNDTINTQETNESKLITELAQMQAEMGHLKEVNEKLRQQVAAADKENEELKKLQPYAVLISAIKRLVADEVGHIVQNTNMLAVLSSEHEQRIRDIVDDAMSAHTDEYDHDLYDGLEDRLGDKVNEAIDSYDLSDKISDYLADNDYAQYEEIKKMLRDAQTRRGTRPGSTPRRTNDECQQATAQSWPRPRSASSRCSTCWRCVCLRLSRIVRSTDRVVGRSVGAGAGASTARTRCAGCSTPASRSRKRSVSLSSTASSTSHRSATTCWPASVRWR